MKALALPAITALCLSVPSCGLPGKVLQTPVRLIQAGVRTVSDVDEPTGPATAESTRTNGLALKTSAEINPGE